MTGMPVLTWPQVGLGLAVLVVGLVIARGVRALITAVLRWRGRSESSATVFGGVSQVVLGALAIGAALTIIFPSVKPVDVIGGIGVISIAAGIAFQTVLGNMFAGMVILGRDRFRVGDQIKVGDHAGTVAELRLSFTALRTFDGRLVLIPNSTLHNQVVSVQTGFERVRSTVRLQLDAATDLETALRVALAAMDDLPEVSHEPAPQVLFADVADGLVDAELRFWSGARQLETKEARHAVIRRVVADFREAGVSMATQVQQVEASAATARLLGGRRDPEPS